MRRSKAVLEENHDTLAGSIVHIDACVRNYVKFTGCRVEEALRNATINPARAVRIDHRKGTLDALFKRLYGGDIETRFRPSFFPFTEPSAEVDLTCISCRGKGCRMCKGTGWIEVLGCGMVNPKVLEMCGIDSKKYSGFAFGIGLERIAMQRYGIPDMRLLYEGDARLLGQLR